MNILKNIKWIIELSDACSFSRKRLYKYFIFLTFLAILGGIFDSIGISLFFPLLKASSNNYSFSEIPFVGSFIMNKKFEFKTILFLISFFLGIKALTDFLTNFGTDLFSRHFLKNVRNYIIESILGRSLLDIESLRIGELSNRVFDDSSRSTVFIISHIKLFIGFATVVAYLGALVFLSFKITLVLIFSFIPFYIFFKWIYSKVSQYTIASNKARDVSNRHLVERLNQARMIKTMGTEQEEIFYFKKQYEDWSRIIFTQSIYKSFAKAVLPSVPFFGVFLLGIVSIFNDSLVSSFLVVLGPIVFIGTKLLVSLYQTNNSWVETKVYEHSIQLVLELKNNFVAIKPFESNFTGKIGKIEFKNVEFSYKDKVVLKDISLLLEPGKPVCIFGSSGSGKTTFANLLRGLVTPTKGEILLDNKKISDFDSKYFSSQVGYMTQDAYLFHGTLRENLLYGLDGKISDEKIWESLSLCQVDNKVKELTSGLNFVVNERGTVFSGGERQRFGLARILLRNPYIIILDEVTSNLDPLTKKLIFQTVNLLVKNKICLVISHDQNIHLDGFKTYDLKEGVLTQRVTQ